MEMRIIMRNAEFGYGKRENVFEDLTFEVEASDIFAILGPNGCGKTTLLKSLLGILKLKRGSIHLDDKNVISMKRNEFGKKIGYVPQNRSLEFPYTVLQMVVMGRASHLGLFSSPSDRDFEIAREAIKRVGISHLTEKIYTNISGGESQLVLIARALAAQPEVLILDEPTSQLDFKNQLLILGTLDRLAKERDFTIVMTTHFPNHALLVSHKALLFNGKKYTIGAVEDVITEQNLKDAYGVNVRIISYNDNRSSIKAVVPIMNFEGGLNSI